jgi:hypothetical protein
MQKKRQYRISPNMKHNINQEMDTEKKKDFRDQSYVKTKCNKFR